MSDVTAADKPDDTFRQRLFDAQPMSPPLRAAYQREIEQMMSPALTPRKAAGGVLLLVILLACTAGLLRAMFVYSVGTPTMIGWVVLAGAFAYASLLIVRDMWRGKHSHKSVRSIAGALTGAAGTLTVVALMLGLASPSDPKSTFNAFYVFVFYFACVAWALESRVVAAELATREQMLRIECRLADLAERFPPAPQNPGP